MAKDGNRLKAMRPNRAWFERMVKEKLLRLQRTNPELAPIHNYDINATIQAEIDHLRRMGLIIPGP